MTHKCNSPSRLQMFCYFWPLVVSAFDAGYSSNLNFDLDDDSYLSDLESTSTQILKEDVLVDSVAMMSMLLQPSPASNCISS